jgi:hypothetical protein
MDSHTFSRRNCKLLGRLASGRRTTPTISTMTGAKTLKPSKKGQPRKPAKTVKPGQ